MLEDQAKVVRVDATVHWLVSKDPDSERWFGVCPEMNANAIGETFTEFLACANEAIALLFEDMHEDGDLEEFLEARGWRLLDPLPEAGEPVQFDLAYEVEQTEVGDPAYA